MLDLVIKGGQVVTPGGAGYWDIGVVGEKIVSVSVPGTLPQEAKKIIDATNTGSIGQYTHSQGLGAERYTKFHTFQMEAGL